MLNELAATREQAADERAILAGGGGACRRMRRLASAKIDEGIQQRQRAHAGATDLPEKVAAGNTGGIFHEVYFGGRNLTGGNRRKRRIIFRPLFPSVASC